MGTPDPGEGEIANTSSTGSTSTSSTWGEEEAADAVEDKEVKVVGWEDFHDAFVRLGGVAVNLSKLRAKKSALSEKLETAIEIGTQSAARVDTLEAMKRRLREKQGDLKDAIGSLHDAKEELTRARETLLPSAQRLFLSAKALSAAQGRIKEADRLLAGEGGHGRLLQLRKLLDGRRRELVGHVTSIYPLGTIASHGTSPNHKSNDPMISHPQQSGGDSLPTSVDELSMAIAGLQLSVPAKKQPGLLNEKIDYETSSTALGYVGHVVSLVASYLDVQLRYPVRLGASRSYIQDPCPATEPAAVDLGPITLPPSKQIVEFPLFSEGQDPTRAAYAIFLLNKDLEQILNRLGVESVGPRHTLSNLSRLIKTVSAGSNFLA
ncbi:unnamed protein product [Calypogeia fissa]